MNCYINIKVVGGEVQLQVAKYSVCDDKLQRSSHLPTPGRSFMTQRQVLATAAKLFTQQCKFV
jgi:hypothetical protein